MLSWLAFQKKKAVTRRTFGFLNWLYWSYPWVYWKAFLYFARRWCDKSWIISCVHVILAVCCSDGFAHMDYHQDHSGHKFGVKIFFFFFQLRVWKA